MWAEAFYQRVCLQCLHKHMHWNEWAFSLGVEQYCRMGYGQALNLWFAWHAAGCSNTCHAKTWDGSLPAQTYAATMEFCTQSWQHLPMAASGTDSGPHLYFSSEIK